MRIEYKWIIIIKKKINLKYLDKFKTSKINSQVNSHEEIHKKITIGNKYYFSLI